MAPSAQLICVLGRIDEANQADPNLEEVDGKPLPREYAYSQHMTRWLHTLTPEPSERMEIACRAQHIERWTMPRKDFPEGRTGYYEWRQACGRMHGRRAAELMAECGFSDEECQGVAAILTKRQLRQDPDTQLLEDVACLVFLERYLADFYDDNADFDKAKWLRIVRRTWAKMTHRGHEHALKLAEGMPPHLLSLLQEALADDQ